MRGLAGGGVTLEPQVAAHAGELFAVIGDPSLYGYIDAPPPASEAALRARLERLETRVSPDGGEHWLNWVVRDSAGTVVGYVQATVTPDHGAEIAYVVGRAYWRRGHAFAACRLMLTELAAHYGVTRITATLDPANAASLALAKKLGLALAWEDRGAHEAGYALDLASAP